MRGRLRRWCGGVLERVNDHPFKAAGVVAAVIGLTVIVVGSMNSAAAAGTTSSGTGVTVATAIDFAMERPAYPAVVLVGLGLLLMDN